MAFKCDFCRKGIQYGHAVSHAKNRVRRIFKPNLQKLKVMLNGVVVRVKFCTSCIKRLKKDGRLGMFALRQFAPSVLPDLPVAIPKKEEVKEEKAKETLKIEEIVGKKK